jgi:hypothetical protein
METVQAVNHRSLEKAVMFVQNWKGKHPFEKAAAAREN